MSRDAFDRFTAKVPSWYYEVVAPGFKYNLTDIASALGLQQLKRARAFQQRRSEIAAAYREALKGLPLRLPPEAQRGSARVAPLRRAADRRRADRPRCVHRSPVRDGIGCSVHYIPLHLQPYWRDRYGLQPAQFPHSQHAYERLDSLPLYTRMTPADVERGRSGRAQRADHRVTMTRRCRRQVHPSPTGGGG
jgi:dTDP-4-amino-4,6-dideoxygalactose transaminase